jgi:CRP/FNR family transcriptional regulator, putaive post-exponential-phase nitrogen-starvation regulator
MHQIRDRQLLQEFLSDPQFESYFSFNATQYALLFHFDSTDYIAREGFPMEYLFYMVKGQAKLLVTHSNGKVSLIDFFKAPCFIGESELVGSQTEAFGVQALTPCYCLALPVAECKDLLLNDTTFLRKLCTFLGTKALLNLFKYTKNQAFPLENRLAAFILATSHYSLYTEKHTEAAEYLGVTRRHLLYVLARLVKDEVLQKNPSGYQILDRQRLQALARELE